MRLYPVLIGACLLSGAASCALRTVGGSDSDDGESRGSADAESDGMVNDGPVTTMSSDEEEGEVSDDDGGFLDGWDCYWDEVEPERCQPPPQCDPYAQDCPEGEKCAPTLYDTVCVPVEGDAQVWEPCTDLGEADDGRDTCDLGLICLDIDPDTGAGTCVALCSGSPEAPECADGTQCVVMGNPIPAYCRAKCDPVAIDCPVANNVCVPDPGDDGFLCLIDDSGGMGSFGATCMFSNACNPGLFCASSEAVPGCASEACCTEFCDLELMPVCAGMGQECVPWWEMGMAPPGLEHVGGCIIP